MPPKKVKRSAGSPDVKERSKTKKDAQEKEGGGKPVRGRRRGGLKDMLNMPTDIIREILQYLHPRDLLSLSWISKSFHAFLMKRSSAHIWRLALKTVDGLPPCPDQLIEPAYATFMFSAHCTGCGTTRNAEPYWEFYARFCKQCGDERLVRDPVWHEIGDNHKIRAEVPIDMYNPSYTIKAGRRRQIYLRSEVNEIADTWEKLMKDEDKLVTFIGTQILKVRKTAKHADSCAKWAGKQSHLRQLERDVLQKERLQDIVARLRLLGYGPELAHLKRQGYSSERYGSLEYHKQVQVPKKLTDRVWLNMRDEMVNIMQEIRDAHPGLELLEALHLRADALTVALKDLAECPEAQAAGFAMGSIALSPEVRDIMCAPADVEVDENSLLALRDQMGDMVERWQARMKAELRRLLTEAAAAEPQSLYAEPPNGVDPLELATTIFECKKHHGDSMLFYPNILQHSCRQYQYTLQKSDVYEQFVLNQVNQSKVSATVLYRTLDITESVTLHRPSSTALKLIKLCGKDPRTVTAKEMDATGVRFVQDTGHIMTWRAAMIHQDNHKSKVNPTWRIASPEEASQAKAREQAYCRQLIWTCLMCPRKTDTQTSWENVLSHLETKHGVKDPQPQSEYMELYADSAAACGVFKTSLTLGTA